MRANTKAALLYIPPVLALLFIWYGMLFIGGSSLPQAIDILHFSVMQSPHHAWFRWLLVLPILCTALCLAHVSPLASKREGRIALVLAGGAVAAASWLTASIEVSVFITLPLFYALAGARSS